MLILFNGYGFKENHYGRACENKVKCVDMTSVWAFCLYILNKVDTRVRNAPHANKERTTRDDSLSIRPS